MFFKRAYEIFSIKSFFGIGRTEKLLSPNLEDLTSMLKSKTKGVTILGSNCDGKNGRWDYVHELAKYIQV